jgi:glutaredoxin
VYCDKAKDFMKDFSIPYSEVKMDPDSDTYASERDDLVAKTKQNTFPFIFVGDAFVGGYTELVRSFETLKFHQLCKNIGIELEMDF